MKVRISDAPFDPWREIENYRHATPALAGSSGATAVFVGTMRDVSQGERGDRHDARALPGHDGETTGGNLPRGRGTLGNSRHAWWCTAAARLAPDEPIVLVAVWAAHRDPAFAACRHIIDALKTRAPFWKHEETASGPRWVEP